MEEKWEIEERFCKRLTELRMRNDVSAREMSLSLGQNGGYVNGIENQKNLPSMGMFFFICDYLGVTPREFFDFDVPAPRELRALTEALRRLSPEKLAHVAAIVGDLVEADRPRG